MNFHRRGRRRTEPVFFAGVGEEAEPGRGLAGLGQGSVAARPLDGGVLTRWGARAPTRGPATALRIAMAARSAFPRSRLRREKQRGEREGKSRMARVFEGAGRSEFFDPRETAARPSDRDERPRFTGPTRRPRPRLRPGCGLCARGPLGRAGFSAFWAALG